MINASEIISNKSVDSFTVGSFFLQEYPLIVGRLIIDDDDTNQIGHKGRQLYIYNEKSSVYNILNRDVFETLFLKMVEEIHAGKLWKTSTINEVWKFLIATPNIKTVQMDQYDNLISMKNGVLNIVTKELHKHSPEFYFSSKLEIEYDKNADSCPNFDKFLEDIFDGDKDVIENALMLGGYLLTTHTKAEKIFFFDGPGGAGKSTLIEIYKMLFTKHQRTALDLDTLADKKDYGRASLTTSRFNAAAEARQAYVESEEVKKMVTGDDVIVRNIYESPQTIKVMAKIVVACNGMPKFQDTSDGIARRLLLFKFKKKFKSEQEMTEADRNNPKIMIKDKELILKINKEMPSILNKFIEYLNKLRSNGWEFNVSESINQTLEDYRASNDSVREFLLEYYEVDHNSAKPNIFVLQHFKDISEVDSKTRNMKASTMGAKISEVFDVDPNPTRPRIKIALPGVAEHEKRVTTYPIRRKDDEIAIPNF